MDEARYGLVRERAKLQCRLSEMLGIDSGFFHYLMPDIDGEPPRYQATIANEAGDPETMRKAAEAIEASQEASVLLAAWSQRVHGGNHMDYVNLILRPTWPRKDGRLWFMPE